MKASHWRQETLREPLRKRGKASPDPRRDFQTPTPLARIASRVRMMWAIVDGAEQGEPLEKVVLARVEGREMEVAMIADRG